MAKAKTAAAPKAKKKVAKVVRAVAKAAPKSKRKTVKKAAGNAADALWKLADHPLVGELLAIDMVTLQRLAQSRRRPRK